MAIYKTGIRKIVVDGQISIRKIRKRPAYNEWQNVDYLIPLQY